MGNIMGRYSSEAPGGVPSFSHTPRKQLRLPLLQASSADPIAQLAEALLEALGGQSLTVDEVFAKHSRRSSRYVFRNYQPALLRLEVAGKITADPPSPERKKGTLGKKVVVTFPSVDK
jgi:hypothetical protein